MKAGWQADDEQAMNEALRLVWLRTDLPLPYFVTLQLVVLRRKGQVSKRRTGSRRRNTLKIRSYESKRTRLQLVLDVR
jgi:hypothetical protein